MIASILETTASFSTPILSDACRELAKLPNAFPPSAGEIYEKCSEIASIQNRGKPLRLAYDGSAAKKKEPRTWLEKWEQQKGYEHFAREKIIDLARRESEK
jgi:hypothetical protein